jgi:NADPH-dependent 2,4-dienoyl-CoA reductase/sulfur reductase-like enzyme
LRSKSSAKILPNRRNLCLPPVSYGLKRERLWVLKRSLVENVPKKRVLILGGGFAGLTVAMELEKKLAQDRSVEITLISRENFFLFTPVLHEVATSDLDLTTIVNPARKMLHRVRFVVGEVEHVDIEHHRVTVSHGFDQHHHALGLDFLVVGPGCVTNLYGIPGLREYASCNFWISVRPWSRTQRKPPRRKNRSGSSPNCVTRCAPNRGVNFFRDGGATYELPRIFSKLREI